MAEINTDKKIEDIANKCLELIEERLKPEQSQMRHSAPIEVKEIGEALKALAEGVNDLKKVMRRP